ncbi:MAG: hypothetical protein H0W70_12370, partial [Actinobacteria bacterium]|nr:hypothetical protein [Actinomycetota bacterium]
MSGEAAWNPWRALRDRPHITFALAPLPDDTGGAVHAVEGAREAIVIDKRLGRRDRNAALTHELVHSDWGGACPGADGPPALAVVAR